MSDMPRVCVFLFKLLQEGIGEGGGGRGEGAWSHHRRVWSRSSRTTQHTFRPSPLTPLPPHPSLPAVCADAATKRLLPRTSGAPFCAGSHQTSDGAELPAPLVPGRAGQERAAAGCWLSPTVCAHRYFKQLRSHESPAFNPQIYIYIYICNFHILNIRLLRLRTVYRWKNAGGIKANISASGCFQDTSGHGNTSVHPPGFLRR